MNSIRDLLNREIFISNHKEQLLAGKDPHIPRPQTARIPGPLIHTRIAIPESGTTAPNPQEHHQLTIYPTQIKYPILCAHNGQGSPKKISPTPKIPSDRAAHLPFPSVTTTNIQHQTKYSTSNNPSPHQYHPSHPLKYHFQVTMKINQHPNPIYSETIPNTRSK